MLKKTFIVSAVIATILVFLAGIYYIPIKTTPIDMSFDAVKFDTDGNEYGTVPVTVKGKICEYLFRNSRITLEISEIEDLYDIGINEYDSIWLEPPDQHGYYWLHCCASSTILGEDTYIMTIIFKEDLSQWEIFRSYQLGSNKDFGHDYFGELDFTYRYKAE